MMAPSDDDIRMLLETYRFCRKFAHAGEVGTNAVTLIAALDDLLARRANDISQHVAGAEEVERRSKSSQKDDLGVAPRVALPRFLLNDGLTDDLT